MPLYFVPGRGYVSSDEEGVDIPFYGSLQLPDGSLLEWGDQGVREVPWLDLPSQYSSETYGTRFQWEPGLGGQTPTGYDVAPGYISALLDTAAAAEAGTLKDYEREAWERMRSQALATPLRDVSQAYWGYSPSQEDPEGLRLLNAMSPDVGRFLLETRDTRAQGTATPHALALAQQIEAQARDWDWRASVPQPSDAFNPLGDQFMMALNALSLATGGAGSFGAFGAAPLGAAGAAGAGAAATSLLGIPTSTLSTIGTLSGLGAMGTGILGTALDQPWLQKLAMGLGVAGGLAGGTAGIANATQGGLTSLGDVGRLLSGAGRVTGALGTASGSDVLRQAAGFLRLGGGLGSTAGGFFEGGGSGTPAASDLVTQRAAGGPMEWDYSWDYGGETPYWEGVDTTGGWWDDPSGGNFTWTDPTGGLGVGGLSLADQVRQAIAQRPDLYGSAATGGGGNWLGDVTRLLGSLSPILGPALSGAGSLVSGGLGATASREAAGTQSAALNRALALQEAQWLQQQTNQAPWLEAGRQALPQLQQLAAQGPGAAFVPPGLRFRREDYDQFFPSTTPGWSPSTYAGYTPTEVPSAAGYRYTPGQVPSAAQYRYTPGAVPTLSGAELLTHDPGVQFRLDEGRKALEASAAARGGLLSGPALAALQRQGQELSSQEYGQAWQRASQQAQLREQWAQVASQMGWSQAEAETRLREMLAQQSTAQNWQQALQEAQARAQQQQFGWQAGFQGQQQGQRERQAYDTDLYTRQWAQQEQVYNRDIAENQIAYERALQAWNANRLNQTQQWNQWASLAGYGPQAAGQLGQFGANTAAQQSALLGQLGSSQALGTLGSAANWQRGIGGLTNNVTDLLAGLNR